MRRLLWFAFAAAALTGTSPTGAVTLDANYEAERERDTGVPASGFSAALSQEFATHFFAGVNYSQLRTDPYDDGGVTGRNEYVAAGAELGAWRSLSERIDLSGTVGYVGSQTRGLDGFEDDPVDRIHGPSGSLTLSVRPHVWTELFIGPSYSYVGREPGWQGTAGVSLKLLHALWFNASYWSGAKKDGFNAGLRSEFGGD